MNQTDEVQYLKLLSIFHYVVGGIAGVFACFPIFHFATGIFLLISGIVQPNEEAASLMLVGLIFTLIAGSIILVGWAFAICIMLTGWFISKRKYHTFCLVVAGLECTFTPFGTVLGVFTIILLIRASIKEMFTSKAQLA